MDSQDYFSLFFPHHSAPLDWGGFGPQESIRTGRLWSSKADAQRLCSAHVRVTQDGRAQSSRAQEVSWVPLTHGHASPLLWLSGISCSALKVTIRELLPNRADGLRAWPGTGTSNQQIFQPVSAFKAPQSHSKQDRQKLACGIILPVKGKSNFVTGLKYLHFHWLSHSTPDNKTTLQIEYAFEKVQKGCPLKLSRNYTMFIT